VSALLRVLVAAGILAIPGTTAAQHEPAESLRATRAGVYSAAQATMGRSLYQLNCVSCHTLASHAGREFVAKWEGRLLWDLYRYVSESMPKSEPGSLAPEEYAGLIAYLLRMNGMPAGEAELPADSTALKKIRIEIATKRDSTQPR
jgi:S-disulfanyl-L-cysteine oxidoreductase SoxD